MSNPTTEGIEVDLRFHVLPVLHLARMAIAMESMLREIDVSRAQLSHLDETLKKLGCPTDYGNSVAEHADMAILSAISLIEAHMNGERLKYGI